VGRLAGTLFPSLGCSLDHLVAKVEHVRGNGETERFGSLEVDNQRKLRWLLNALTILMQSQVLKC
jgi:hypothetical protein